jgi:hypothetical protein
MSAVQAFGAAVDGGGRKYSDRKLGDFSKKWI